MIPKKNKISHLFFKNLLKKGKNINTPYFSLRVNNHSYGNYRLACVVSRKIARKAVKRNLSKRRFLSILFSYKNILCPNMSYIFFLKQEILTKNDVENISQEIEKSLNFIYKNCNK
jgi:ribonuclease P protein component